MDTAQDSHPTSPRGVEIMASSIDLPQQIANGMDSVEDSHTISRRRVENMITSTDRPQPIAKGVALAAGMVMEAGTDGTRIWNEETDRDTRLWNNHEGGWDTTQGLKDS